MTKRITVCMFLLYLDESGVANGWNVQKHYVLAGVAVFEGQIHRITSALDAIQEKYFPNISIPISFHATEIRRGKKQFKDFTPTIRQNILKDVYTVISNTRFPNLIAFATGIHISAVTSPEQVRSDTLEDVCSRFNTFLIRQHKVGKPSKGLLIIDRNRAEEYRQLVNDFKIGGTKSGYIDNIVDIPYFARCPETRMLQVADFVSNAVFRYFEKNDSTYLNLILPRFDRREKDHPPDGLKHITKESCSCIACSWRTQTKLQIGNN
jgi:hypothetical protein